MEFYILNTSLRARDRRHSADLTFAGQKARPGQRLYLTREQVVAEYDRIFQLLESGMIELRATATGSPAGLEGLKPKESKVESQPTPKSAPKPEPELARMTARLEEGPPSVSELLSMTAPTVLAPTPEPAKVVDIRPVEEPRPEAPKFSKKGRGRPQSTEE